MASGTEASFASERAVPVTVLIVDDEDATRSLCRDVVAESGLRTKLAATTEQALDIPAQSPIEIVIIDLKVPQLGGLSCSSESRNRIPRPP
jgi:DNA-binding NtrC family response regulator